MALANVLMRHNDCAGFPLTKKLLNQIPAMYLRTIHICSILVLIRMFKKVVRQGRSEVRDAKNNERHVSGRARVGERPVS